MWTDEQFIHNVRVYRELNLKCYVRGQKFTTEERDKYDELHARLAPMDVTAMLLKFIEQYKSKSEYWKTECERMQRESPVMEF